MSLLDTGTDLCRELLGDKFGALSGRPIIKALN